MSNRNKIPRAVAMRVTEKLVELLKPYCQRVEIAGSLRRGKAEVGDIEIVVMPKLVESGLFGDMELDTQFFSAAMSGVEIRVRKGGTWYKQFEYQGMKVDLFITSPEKWGCVYLIRTGSAEWIHKLVTPRKYGGLCPSHMRFQDGRLWEGQDLLDTPEEEDVFRALGLDFVEAELRN